MDYENQKTLMRQNCRLVNLQPSVVPLPHWWKVVIRICKILCLGAIVVVWIATYGKLGKLTWIVSTPCWWVVVIRICKILCLGAIVVVWIATDGKLGKLTWIVSIPCWWLVIRIYAGYCVWVG